MKYSWKKSGEKYLVMEEGQEGPVGEWSTEEGAATHVRSLNFSDKVGGKKVWMLSQEQTDYTIMSPRMEAGELCNNCRWFEEGYWSDWDGWSERDGCHLVENYPQSIRFTGWCNRFEVNPALIPKPEPPNAKPVYIVDPPSVDGKSVLPVGETANRPANAPNGPQTVAPVEKDEIQVHYAQSRVAEPLDVSLPLPPGAKALIARLVHGRRSLPQQGFKVSSSGKWLGWWTNNAEDRQGEVFALKAIDGYIEAVHNGDWPYPELWYCHIPGMKHGVAEEVGRVGNMVYAAGKFDDTLLAARMKAHYKAVQDEQMSHGYFYDPDLLLNKVYYFFRTYEVSPLEKGWAANEITGFSGGEKAMAEQLAKLAPHQVDALGKLGFSADEIAAIEAEGQGKSGEIAASGKRVKAEAPTVAQMTGGATANAEASNIVPMSKADIEAAITAGVQAGVAAQKDALKAEIMGEVRGALAQFFEMAPPASKSSASVIGQLNQPNPNQEQQQIGELVKMNENPANPQAVDDPVQAKLFPFLAGQPQV